MDHLVPVDVCPGTGSYILVNLDDDVAPRDPRQQVLRWLSDEQLDGMRSLVALAYRIRAGGRR